MLCQHCHKNEATARVKTIVNGEYAEYRLCSECARELGYVSAFSDFSADLSGMLSSFLGAALPARTGATRCPTCGAALSDIKKSGKVGCADCYELFLSELTPTIRSIHGNTVHTGKHPVIEYSETASKSADKPAEKPREDKKASADRLKAELKKAIDEENFERAAELRDEIRELEGSI